MWLAVSHEAFQIDRFACVFAIAVRSHPRALTALAPFAASASGSARGFGAQILALRLPGMVSLVRIACQAFTCGSDRLLQFLGRPKGNLLAGGYLTWPLQWPDCVQSAPHVGEPQACQDHQFGCGLLALGAVSRFLPFPRANLAPAFSATDALPRAARKCPSA